MPDPRYHFEPLFYHAVTPIHVGRGQDVGIVDLPVERERTTGHPYLPGSGIRGALRDRCEAANPPLTQRIFGSDDPSTIRAGCLSVLDAHLLLFPVRTQPGLFHWITCRFAIERWRDLCLRLIGRDPGLRSPGAEPAEGSYFGTRVGPLFIEEFAFEPAGSDWSWNLDLATVPAERVVLLSDVDFLYFVRHATTIRQRNRLSTAKTVLPGALFSVEMVPAEAWFGGFFGTVLERVPEQEPAPGGDDSAQPATPMAKDEVMRRLRDLLTGNESGDESFVPLGGDESVGLGITRLQWWALPTTVETKPGVTT